MKLDDLKILLVEDEANTRSTIRAMLAEMGVNQVFESKDGEEAQVFMDMDAMDIDVVISDWNMPQFSGFDLLKHLRERKPSLPFIMVTGRADINSVKDALGEGVDGYIRKPFSMKELENKIVSIVAKRAA